MESTVDRSHLVQLVKQIMAGEGTEDEIHERLMFVRKNVPDPYVSDYIFWPDRQMTAEEIIDRALAYKPIQL